MKVIETNRLIIRRFMNEDACDLHEYLSHSSIYLYEPGGPVDFKGAKAILEKRINDERFWAIVCKQENKLIGNIYLAQDPWTEIATYSLGYIISPSFQDHGYCSEASKAILNYAFQELNAHRVEARCNVNNSASNRVLEKLGFRHEGTLKNNVFFHRDAFGKPIWNTSNLYGLLSEEWPVAE